MPVFPLLLTIGLFVTCVIIHYEGLTAMTRWFTQDLTSPRIRIAILICAQFILHLIEITIFAFGYYILIVLTDDYGSLLNVAYADTQPAALREFADFFYYSAVAYTTLGMGEIIPVGAVRFLTGMEAVGGLLLITWSASFTFIEMQRYWVRR